MSQALVELKKELNKEAPDLYQDRYSSQPPTVSEIQQAILPNEQLLIYSFYDDQLTIANIQSDTSWMTTNSCPNMLEKVDTLYASLLSGDQNKWSHSQNVSTCFIDNIFDPSKKHVTVIWPGSVPMIPFDLLMTEHTFDHTIRYLNTCRDVNNSINPKQNNSKIAAYSTNSPSTTDLTTPILASRGAQVNLPGASKEVNEILSIFPDYTNLYNQATRNDFIVNSSNNKILHLALHSVVNKHLPSFSFLQFSDSVSTVGRIYFHEIQQMELNADLVCLSSCNSGMGKYLDGQGTASLGLAFRQSGCKNIIQSLWPVNDASTADLMKYFYREINAKKSIPEALALAKKQFQKHAPAKWGHPYYWAGFIYFGDHKNISFSSSFNWTFLFISLALLLIATYLVFCKKSKP